jgi:hemolysin activation/secretion protein
VFSADTSVSLGARFWEADWNADIDDRRVPETDYVTLNSVVTYVRALENGDQWSTTVTAQMAEEALFSNNQISIGGWGTVRGNSKDSFSGDRGLYLRTEYSLQARRIRSVQRYFELPIVFRPAFFADVGRVDSIAQLRTRSLSGVGTSVSFQAGRARIDGAIAIPVGGAERREGQGAEAYLQFFSSIF